MIVDLDAAALALATATSHHHDMVALVENLLGRVVDLLPGFQPLPDVAADSLSTAVYVGTRYRGLVMPFHVLIEDRQAAARSPRWKASEYLAATSTFSCDIAYPDSPTASRALAWSKKYCTLAM